MGLYGLRVGSRRGVDGDDGLMRRIDRILQYYDEMAQRGRLLLVTNAQGLIVSCASFFLLRSLEEAHQFHCTKGTWEAPPDTEDGTIVYIDQLQGSVWNRDIRNQFRDQLEAAFPHATLAVWYRPHGEQDRRVLVWRRGVTNARACQPVQV